MPLNSPRKVLFYRMFPALLKADEAYMGLDALGSGILFGILNHQCLNGSVPADPVALSGIVRATPEEVRVFLATFTKLETLETLEGGSADRLANPYLHNELMAIHALIEARRQAGAKGGQKTQAKARPAQARDRKTSSSAQAELEAPLEPPSSRQEQEEEEEADKSQIQRNSTRQLSIHLGANGHRAPPADAAADDAEEDSLPGDIRERLSRFGIAEHFGPDLCDKADGPLGLRRVLDLVESKTKSGEIRSPSGFLLHCVADLAQEARSLYEEAHIRALNSHQAALMDPRWVQLPEVCRGSLEILHAWCEWWDLQEQVSAAGEARSRDLVAKASEARISFLEACLRCHPDRTEINAALTEKLLSAGDLSKKPMVAKRLRVTALEELLGLSVKVSRQERPPM